MKDMNIEGESGNPMNLLFLAAGASIGGLIASHLPEINEWMRLVCSCLSACASITVIVLGIRKWKKGN